MHFCSYVRIQSQSIPWQQSAAPSNQKWHTAYRAFPPTLTPYQTCEGGEQAQKDCAQKKKRIVTMDGSCQPKLYYCVWSLPHALLESKSRISMLRFFLRGLRSLIKKKKTPLYTSFSKLLHHYLTLNKSHFETGLTCRQFVGALMTQFTWESSV